MHKIKLIALSWLTAAALLLLLSIPVQAQLSDVTQPGDPIIPSSNNSPGSEGVANAIDNQPTKYLNFDKLNTGFTVTPRVGLTVVQCLTLTSANDAPERDPASYVLSGSYDGTNFTQIAAGPVPVFATRFQKIAIRFDNNTPYLIYKLIFPDVANAAAANSMQIAEVELLGFLAPTDVTQPGDPIVASSNNSPGSEAVANAIDNQPTKYLNFDKVNTGFTVTPSVGGTLVTGLSLTSANDAPDRDPSSYTLEGSLDGTTFFPISAGSVPSFGADGTARFYKNYIFFSNARAYRSYRIIFPTTAGNSTCCMQISEVEFLGVVSDLAQDVTQPGDPIVGTSNNTPGSEGVANAIDNQPTKYLNFDKLNTGFTVSPQSGLTLVSGLTLTSANDAPERDPASYVLSGSYDNTNFTQIAAGNLDPFVNRFEKHTILFNNTIPYLQYRLIFPTVANAGAANSMQISEVELLGVLAPTDVTVPGDPIVPSSNNSPGSEAVANAIDNQPTKYLNFDKVNTGFTVTPNVGDTIVSGLTLTSANDAPDRDPSSYTLDGSNDGSNYVAISSGSVPSFGPDGTARFYKNYIFFTNTKSFKSYRLIFPTTAGNSTCCMQISEVEFLGITPGVVNTNPATDLIVRQPVDTSVLLGSTATFRVELSGPWKVQWYKNGVAIPGATTASYTTPAATAADDGSLFQAVVQSPHGVQTSDQVMLSILTPSTTESIALSWEGSGANGAPTAMLPDDITGVQKQAYWNNLTGGSGSAANLLNSSNAVNSTITVQWATSGEWGVGTGNQDATERMLNGMVTSFATTAAGAQTVTFSSVPAGNHSLFLYTVQVPKEFFNLNFSVTTHDSGGNDVVQQRFIRPLNADEYNPNPGFFLVTSTDAADRGVGSFMRFDNLQPGPDGVIQISFYSPGRAQPPNAEPIRGPGLNGLQLLLNPPAVPEAPSITSQPVSANGLAGGCITLSVEATGPALTYQWFKNNQKIAGATGPRLTLNNLGTNDIGNYFVLVSNGAGSVHSRTAVVGILPSSQLSLGLISYFKFDDGDGLVGTNAVAGGQNLQVLGGNTFPDWPPGQIGTALTLEPGDYGFVPNYTKPGTITVAGWVNADNDQWGPIINNWITGRPIGSSGQFIIDAINDSGVTTLRATIEVGPNKVSVSGPVDGLLGVWHHFAMTANGVTLSLYWDGQLVDSVDYGGAINSSPFPWLAVGARFDPTTQPADANPILDPSQPLFPGSVDDFALWNRSLTAAEIQGVYFGGLAGQNISQDAPVLSVGICPPTITCPGNQTVECTGGLTPVTFTATAVDSSGAPVPVFCNPPSGTGFRLGQSNVVCIAIAGTNNTASCTFRVSIVDTVPPRVTCPSNIVTSATSPAGAVVSYIAAASDPCGIASFECSPVSGSTFPPGPTTVTCNASDSSSNSASCTFTVTVGGNHPPVAVNDTVTTTEGTAKTFNVLANDTDADGDALSVLFAFLANPIHGSLTIASDGTTVYTPDAGFLGTVSFEYTISDGHPGGTNHATVTINVVSANQPPVCAIQIPCSLTLPGESGSFAIALDGSSACVTLDGSSSSDADHDPLTFAWTVDGVFPVSLTASQEPPPNGTGSGSGTVTLSGNTLTVHITFSGLSANSTLAHIHGPAPRGVNAGVLYSLIPITTLGSTAGTINGTVTLVDGTGGFTLAQQLQQLRDGLWYVNIHTTAHPGGEIRGQLDTPTLTGPVVNDCFDLGCHTIALAVSDGKAVSRCSTTLCVITASDGVEKCIDLLDNADLGRKNKRPLIASLKAAAASFDRGDFVPGVNQLEACQNKIRAQIAPSNPAAAAALTACIQQIVDAVDCGAAAAH